MADKTNGPRDQREPSQKMNQTASKSTRRFDPSRCDRSCGQCFITFAGDHPWCEVEFTRVLRRELSEALAGGGDGG